MFVRVVRAKLSSTDREQTRSVYYFRERLCNAAVASTTFQCQWAGVCETDVRQRCIAALREICFDYLCR